MLRSRVNYGYLFKFMFHEHRRKKKLDLKISHCLVNIVRERFYLFSHICAHPRVFFNIYACCMRVNIRKLSMIHDSDAVICYCTRILMLLIKLRFCLAHDKNSTTANIYVYTREFIFLKLRWIKRRKQENIVNYTYPFFVFHISFNISNIYIFTFNIQVLYTIYYLKFKYCN